MFKIRKIASVLTSAVMMSSTVGLAVAATYPAPFVSGGSPDVAIVYGSNGQLTDYSAAVQLMDNLNGEVTAGTDDDGDSGVSGGDGVLIATSSDNINLGNTWSVFTGTIDDDEMPTLLADGTYRADDNDEFDYEQKIELGAPTFSHFRDSDYEAAVDLESRTPVLGFKLNSNTYVFNYTVDFTTDAESSVTSGDLDDFEGSDLPLFGKSYYVSDADNGSSSTYLGTFTLLDSANTAVVNEGETVTVTAGDSTYEVSISFIGSSSVKLSVNGETTNSLGVGETFRLDDGTYVGIREINVQDYAGGTKNTEFSIGSGKIELISNSEIKLNDETVNGMKSYIYRSTGSSGSEKMNKIVLEWRTDEEAFLTPELELAMPVLSNVKFVMPEIVRSEEEVIKLENDGDNSIAITVPLKDGPATINLLYNSASTGNLTGIGKDSDELLATTNTSSLTFIEKSSGTDYHEQFVASYETTSEAESYLMRARVSTDTSQGRNETTIERFDGDSNSWVEVCEEKIAGDSCNIGLVSLTIGTVAYTAGGTESVVLTAGTGVSFNELFTAGGLKIYLPFEGINGTSLRGIINFSESINLNSGQSVSNWWLFMDEEDKDDDIAQGTEFNFTVDNTAGSNYPLQISQVNGAGSAGASGLEVGDSQTYEAYIVSDVATRILHYTNPDEDWVEVFYPSGESETHANVYLVEDGASVDGGSSGGGSASAIGIPIMDTEVNSVANKNLIVVGGSCVNSYAATLLGSASQLCGADFTAATNVGSGQYLIQTFARGSKVATLVAGYNAPDTVNAATALRTEDGIMTDVGKKYIGSGTLAPVIQEEAP